MEEELSPENPQLGTLTNQEDNFPTKIDQSIKRIIEKEGLIECEISKRCFSSNGGNYLGELYEVDVKGKAVSGEKELNMFIKNIIKNNDSVKIVSISDIYKTELFAYQELSKILEELQNEANIPLKERYKMVKLYESSDEDMVIMENISKKGFRTYYDRMDLASLEFLELCVKNIARFHGLSFVLKERKSNYFSKRIKTLKYPLIFGDELKDIFQNICNIAIKHIDDNLKDKVMKLYKSLDEKLAGYLNDETTKTCLCHGDYRPNNILMKADVQEIIAVDYQVIYYGCPVFDLLYLIYSCTDRDFRKKYMSYLQDLYYDTLKTFLKYFDIDINAVYPRYDFDKVFKDKLDYGLLVALYTIPFLFVREEEVSGVTLQKDITFQVDSKMKERLQDIIEEFTELGFV